MMICIIAGSAPCARPGVVLDTSEKSTANLPTDIVDFTGFDSSIILI